MDRGAPSTRADDHHGGPDSAFWADLEAAIEIVAASYPDVGPVSIDRSAATVTLASGARVRLRGRTGGPERLAEWLADAARADTELAGLRLSSWDEAANRLGLVLRPRRLDTVGVAVGRQLQLRVVLETEHGLVPILHRHLTPWRREPDRVTAVAIANSRAAPITTATIAPGVWAVVGSTFTVGHLLAIETAVADVGSRGALVTRLGDGAMLVAPVVSYHSDQDLTALAVELGDLSTAIGLQATGGAILRCWPRARLAAFQPEAIDHDRQLDQPGARHHPDGQVRG